MARPKGTSRVGGGAQKRQPVPASTIPSMRERRPIVFWVVVIAVAAMVLTTVTGFFGGIVLS